jgi:hypothetical protein
MPGTSAFLDKHQPQPQEFVQHYAHARDRNPKSPTLRNSPHYFAKYWTLRMGGFGSGRSGGRPTTDSCLTLDLSQLRRDGFFRPGFAGAGSLIWTNTTTGERIGSISYEAHLRQESGSVRLRYSTARWDGERLETNYWIELETTSNPSEADVGGSSAHAREGGWRSSTCPMAPSPSHSAKPTVSHIAHSAKHPMIEPCVALSNCRPSSERRVASEIRSPSQSGCAGELTIAILNGSRVLSGSSMATWQLFSTSSILAWGDDPARRRLLLNRTDNRRSEGRCYKPRATGEQVFCRCVPAVSNPRSVSKLI